MIFCSFFIIVILSCSLFYPIFIIGGNWQNIRSINENNELLYSQRIIIKLKKSPILIKMKGELPAKIEVLNLYNI